MLQELKITDPKQLRLSEAGEISFQNDPTNPLPGDVIAQVIKGESLIAPAVKIMADSLQAFDEQDGIQKALESWLNNHIKEGLEPLFRLQGSDIESEPAQKIAQKLFASLGILPREDLQNDIDQMDEVMRQSLRPKKVRFGPLLVYLPELKKPAAVRLQAMLLSVWNDKTLPAEVPSDGIVSFSIEGKDIDADYYRAIGYPVYGPRAMRVDMLDRVVCAIYDYAKEGKFQAQHQMAEWLGSNIEDLYKILEAMGHKKIYDPAPKEEAIKEASTETEVCSENKSEQKNEKPELATFALKKGKASGYGSKKSFSNKKNNDQVKKFRKKKIQTKNKNPRQEKERVYKAEAKINLEDSPFAILNRLYC